MAHARPRVLVLSHWFEPFQGGAELALRALLRELTTYEFDVITARRRRELARQERHEHVTVHRVGFGGAADLFLFPGAAVRLAAKLHSRRPYQLMWASMANEAGRAALLFNGCSSPF